MACAQTIRDGLPRQCSWDFQPGSPVIMLKIRSVAPLSHNSFQIVAAAQFKKSYALLAGEVLYVSYVRTHFLQYLSEALLTFEQRRRPQIVAVDPQEIECIEIG